MALREFLHILERNGQLHRTQVEIDPVLELSQVSIRALREGKPGLLIERPKRSNIPTVVNHFTSEKRIELALGRHPDQIGEQLIGFLERAFPPTFKSLIENKHIVKRFLSSRPKLVTSGLSQEVVTQPDLDTLPIQVCWPNDGGRFITYGQVITYDPRDARRNIGIYRMHVFDKASTGMHWQIQKGGGFHYYKSETLGKEFDLSASVG